MIHELMPRADIRLEGANAARAGKTVDACRHPDTPDYVNEWKHGYYSALAGTFEWPKTERA
ncbi:hypothetical protein P3W85_29845 [Cupriavidus basilensis]|uniref:Uncharacterized protein n=1 Tax=Cupriavidus basilensis TaxID=68895 RepID=A0ABT6AWW9_9BURK|nr:hypothetical protein [Cupriavidus basilensis]MDF3837126.1 hypothetical protein [Cupriavidus basilensis]